jgi:anti-sigma factor RsiW
LSPSELAGFLDRDLDSEGRRRVEAHLDDCAACRGELADVARLADAFRSPAQGIVQPQESRSRRRVWGGIALGGALAASLAMLMLLGPPAPSSSPAAQPVRAPTTGEGLARIDVLTAPEMVGGATDSLVFTWHSVGADVYRFALLSESGEPLWTRETGDTSLSLPSTVVLTPGHAYWWRVDATAEGVVATSGARLLRVSP